jgi:hypothetical protein
MTLPIPVLQTEPSVLPELIGAGYALITRYWWVFVLIGLAWYLRWYGKAMRNDVDAAPLVGVGSALEHAAYTARSAVPAIIIIGSVIVAGIAWMFNIGTGILVGLSIADPTTYAVVISGALAVLDPFGVPHTTLRNVAIAFVGTFLVMVLLRRISGFMADYGGDVVSAAGGGSDSSDASDSSSDSDDDGHPMDFLYKRRDGD